MKNIRFYISLFVMGIALALTSCEEEIVVSSTHTDASALVGGTYNGSITNGTTTYDNAVVVLTKVEADSLQAVSVAIQFNNLNLAANLNVAKANDGFAFSSGLSNTQKMSGRMLDNNLTLNVPLNRSGTALSNASTGVVWVFTGAKN